MRYNRCLSQSDIYEKELQSSLVEQQRSTSSVLIEARGVNNDFAQIIDILFEFANSNNDTEHLMLYEDHKGRFLWKQKETVSFPSGCFIRNCGFFVTFMDNRYFSSEASYAGEKAQYDVKTDTIYGFRLHYHAEKLSINRSEFELSMWHELHHAYRHYCILREYYNRYGIQKPYMPQSVGSLRDQQLSDTEKAFVDEMLYLMDRDEIDAYCSSVYAYVCQHPEVTIRNYKDYLPKIKGYLPIKSLSAFLRFWSKPIDAKKHRMLEYIRAKRFNNNKRSSDAYIQNWIVRKTSFFLTLATKQFYKVLGYAFDTALKIENNSKPILQ